MQFIVHLHSKFAWPIYSFDRSNDIVCLLLRSGARIPDFLALTLHLLVLLLLAGNDHSALCLGRSHRLCVWARAINQPGAECLHAFFADINKKIDQVFVAVFMSRFFFSQRILETPQASRIAIHPTTSIRTSSLSSTCIKTSDQHIGVSASASSSSVAAPVLHQATKQQ